MAANLISKLLTILLIDPDAAHRERLADRLRTYGYRVLVPDLNPESARLLESQALHADVAIFEVTKRDERIVKQLQKITRLRKCDGTPVLVLCCSRTYHGPRFQLQIEEMGGRYLYDQTL